MPAPTPAPTRVLIIDDCRDAAESLRAVLGLHGFPAAVAYDGAEGLALAGQIRPHLVFSDIGMPEVDGFTLAAALRADPRTAGARLIAVTGFEDDAVRERALEVGFEAVLRKPADPAALIALLTKVASELGSAGPAPP